MYILKKKKLETMANDYLHVMILAAFAAGREIMNIYTDPLSDFEIERKADNSPLTIADRRAHHVILSYLEQTPYPVLSEEGRDIPYEERCNWNSLWIVDPLDGTREFIKRNGEFTVNIALVTEGIPVSGVIYVPVTNEMYVGDNRGAFKLSNLHLPEEGGNLIYTEERMPIASAVHNDFVVVASRSHLSAETETFIELLRRKYGAVRFRSSGSSIKICLVAEGSADIYPRFAPTMEWDTAAGHAVARASGFEIYQCGTDVPLLYNKEDLLNPWFVVEKLRTSKDMVR